MRGLLTKIRRWTKVHRMSRKQATLQNFLLSTVLILLICIMAPYLRNQQEATVEELIDQWYSEQMFGEGEIVAVQSFQEGDVKYLDVIVSKFSPSGESYDARLYLRQEEPWKWGSVGWDYGYISVEYRVEHRIEKSDPIYAFTEFNTAESSHVEIQENSSGAPISVTVSIHFSDIPGYDEDCADTTFQVDLQTGNAVLLQQGVHYAQRYGDSQLERIETWLSEPRMVQIAQVLVEEMG